MPDRTRDRNLEMLRRVRRAGPAGEGRGGSSCTSSPRRWRSSGSERVEALVVAHNELYESEDGSLRAPADRPATTLPVGLVFRAIGYQGVPLPGIPFDAMARRDPQRGRADHRPAHAATPVTGEYVVGWIKRGPRGIIGTNKPDS